MTDAGDASSVPAMLDGTSDDPGVEQIAVHIRVRPSSNMNRCIDRVPGNPAMVQVIQPNNELGQQFEFTSVMDEWCLQADVYSSVVQPLLPGLFEGKSAAVLCYGQTGSGKTHTMIGEHTQLCHTCADIQPQHLPEDAGIAMRACADLFSRIYDQTSSGHRPEITVHASFLEIYCERVIDLLSPDDKKGTTGSKIDSKASLDVVGGAGDTITVKDATCVLVDNAADALALLSRGMKARVTAATKSNSRSSRGHAIFVLTIKTTNTLGQSIHGQFYLCDLAGSEKLKKTEAVGLRLKEASDINTSLLSLHLCIDRLSNRHYKYHIPYRNSKLTRLLQNALGGSGRAAMICTVNPSILEYEETMSTLRFGRTAATVENHVVANVSERSLAEWQLLLVESQHAIRQLRAQLLHAKRAGSTNLPMGEDQLRQPRQANGPRSACQVLSILPHGMQETLECPLTNLRFREPVIASDGYTYERSAITELFEANGQDTFADTEPCSPMTGLPFASRQLIPNRQLVNMMSAMDAGTGVSCVCMVADGPDRVESRIGLPDECIFYILSYMPTLGVVACSMTCTRLRSLTNDERCWSSLLAVDFGQNILSSVGASMMVPSKTMYIQLYAKKCRSKQRKMVPETPQTMPQPHLRLLYNGQCR